MSNADCKTECKEASCEKKTDELKANTNELNNVKRIIGVVSGKGGVGKSLVTSLLAVLTKKKGYQVGILDADITGPSIPKMFGIKKRASGSEFGIFPEQTSENIKIMSVNLLLEKEDSPVIWRGPIISNTVKQFWTDVLWGDLDYLFIDMPPGTGDVPLTVFQSIPLDGIVVVTSPQELVHLIVRKAYNMAKSMNIPVLGIVENMSYLECPDCGKEIKLFGDSQLEDVAAELGLEVLGKLPLNPQIAELCDQGKIETVNDQHLLKAVEYLTR